MEEWWMLRRNYGCIAIKLYLIVSANVTSVFQRLVIAIEKKFLKCLITLKPSTNRTENSYLASLITVVPVQRRRSRLAEAQVPKFNDASYTYRIRCNLEENENKIDIQMSERYKQSSWSSTEKNSKFTIGIIGLFLELLVFLHYNTFIGWTNHFHIFRVLCRILGCTCLLLDGKAEFFGIAYVIMTLSWTVEWIYRKLASI
ncbi:uncharacterized protein LOC126736678 [Anthonomus grandis grandis]|uniref:uncharacterized protein LOC126736678 n=1 Tax=Anthonomus grandis grandis TaxID=2921223 RepID=UPI002165C468|nr:uncharacterized protein LOC126736678 [Anthonomus grandis grandis]